MYNVGDLVVYSSHGICRVDDICEKTLLGETKKYYELHPVEDDNLKISVPVDNDKVTMLELLNKEEAEEILESFKSAGAEWIELDNHRNEVYTKVLKSGDRMEIAKVANALIRNKIRVEAMGKKFHEKDRRILASIEGVLFEELAFALEISIKEVDKKIMSYIKENITKGKW